MTPLILVSFLVSLALVDLRYSALRAHYHADADQASRLPRWLHRIVYRYRPYRYVAVDERGRPVAEGRPRSPGSPGREAEDYYHSKQRKLMKMEAAEAFEIRGSVLVALGLLSLGVFWAAWRLAAWGFGTVMAWLS
ncbi:71a70ed5-14ee-4d00-97da-034e1f121df3 [Thermothielavioides terrestris]|uniref:71a70ed5-14ee-4d00-97da-034e1f121df3 n=1 Tax=Thermothielavioides terrestris TaxID=2587410 RepID=A0A3S4B177_9PEZI|nr:71a70ed5-14ee-4d00-97da-034e1f121df3 [Thermothielavioides terrestris]